jgi:hypothetical protein
MSGPVERQELDLRLGASFTRFNTLLLQNAFRLPAGPYTSSLFSSLELNFFPEIALLPKLELFLVHLEDAP